ncbi:hypothetical protein [Clostridium sp. BL-8]|uniref:hypothetical protein n=1 Tax=Clostridium sp. BL-8 TaxID=349938 RepID=UPI0009C6B51A|nr:hypothetical protein [Clostridium sp. BL-8]OOM73138.1 hypothetical protein CLOBL_47520 [Clostridium sp. BL-8]
MKKVIIAVIAATMLLSTTAFASTKPANVNNTNTKSISIVNQFTGIHILTCDPE